jgi:hypothetical protein
MHSWLGDLNAWHKALCDELFGMPARVRSAHELGAQQNVRYSIITIEHVHNGPARGVALKRRTHVGPGSVALGEVFLVGDLLFERCPHLIIAIAIAIAFVVSGCCNEPLCFPSNFSRYSPADFSDSLVPVGSAA